MFWTVDTNLDSHGPGVGDIKHTERSLGLYPCPGQTSPLPVLYSHTHGPKKEGDAQNSECSAWSACTHGDGCVSWSRPQSSTWGTMSHICGAHSQNIPSVPHTLFTKQLKWRESDNMQWTKLLRFQLYKDIKWRELKDIDALHLQTTYIDKVAFRNDLF